MIGRVSSVLNPPFLRRLDRWLLLRAPMFWRTRLLYVLLFLSLLILATVPFALHSIDSLSQILDGPSQDIWWFQVCGAFVVLGLWVRVILRKAVGEMALYRHIITVLAVAIGSYAWLVAPSLLAYAEIRIIARVELSDQELNKQLGLLTQHSDWNCIPSSKAIHEVEMLREVIERYYPDCNIETGPVHTWAGCKGEGTRRVISENPRYAIAEIKKIVETIQNARSFWSNYYSTNQFAHIRYSFHWFMAIAFGIGVITAMFSYPLYVWRRTFLRP